MSETQNDPLTETPDKSTRRPTTPSPAVDNGDEAAAALPNSGSESRKWGFWLGDPDRQQCTDRAAGGGGGLHLGRFYIDRSAPSEAAENPDAARLPQR